MDILIVHSGLPAEKKLELQKIVLESADKIGLDHKYLKDHVELENLNGKEFSAELTVRNLTFKYVIIIGQIAFTKVSVQLQNKDYINIPDYSLWSDEKKPLLIKSISEILALFGAEHINKPEPILVKAEEALANPAITPTELIEFEKYLELEVNNSRYHACIFSWKNDKPHVDIRYAGKRSNVSLEGVIPILVSKDILKDEEKLKETRELLDSCGYTNPYLLSPRDFTMLLRLYIQLAKSGKAQVEITAD